MINSPENLAGYFVVFTLAKRELIQKVGVYFPPNNYENETKLLRFYDNLQTTNFNMHSLETKS